MRFYITLGCLLSMFASCGQSKPDQSNDNKTQMEEQTKTYPLSDDSVDGFQLGTMIPIGDKDTPYTFKRMKETEMQEGTEVKVEFLEAYRDGTKQLKIEQGYDFRTDTYLDIFREIHVLSSDYETSKGIGVGSSVDDFAKAYPEVKAYYSYVSDRFWLQNFNERYQFVLDSKLDGADYSDSDMEEVSLEDFTSKTTIKSIRFFDKDF